MMEEYLEDNVFILINKKEVANAIVKKIKEDTSNNFNIKTDYKVIYEEIDERLINSLVCELYGLIEEQLS